MISTTLLADHKLRAFPVLAAVLALSLTLACGAEAPQAPPEPTTNADLNLGFSALPSGFEVTQNNADVIRLKATNPEDPSEMWVEVGERSDFGIPITEIVTAQKELFEALPNGDFSGNNELMTQNGRAFYSRGRYTHDDAAVEETRIFQVHPAENRLITLHYRYPAAEDSGARVQQLLFLLGELTVPDSAAEAMPPVEPSD